MTLADELKILDDEIKANQAQYDLDREAANISALTSKELDKCEHLTNEDLGYKPGVVEKAKFEYSPSGEILSGKVNSQHSFVKFKDVSIFKDSSLDSMHKKLNDFHKKSAMFKKLNPQTKGKEDLKGKVKDNAGDLFNESHYVCQDKCNEEENDLNIKEKLTTKN